MKIVTGIKDWINWAASDAAAINDLFYAVKEIKETDLFICEEIGNNKLLIKGLCIYEQLVISKHQQEYFLEYLEKNYAYGDVDSYYSFEYAMMKND